MANRPSRRDAAIWSPNSLMSCALISNVRSGAALVERLLERRHADAPVGRKEILPGVAPLTHVGGDDRFDGVDDVLRGEAWPGDLADRGRFIARAAERDLVGFLARPLQA